MKNSFFEKNLHRLDTFGAKWIGYVTDKEYVTQRKTASLGMPCPVLKKVFTAENDVREASLLCSAYGLYVVYLNGVRVNDSVFDPGFTQYDVRVQAQVYDVAGLLNKGENVLTVYLGDGWYTGNVGWDGRGCFGDYPLAFLCCLYGSYTDGRQLMLVSDESFTATKSEIVYSDMQMGECVDARLVPQDRFAVESDGKWENVVIVVKPMETLWLQSDPPVRVGACLHPKQITHPDAATTIYDFGQNMSGFVNAVINASAGTKIRLRHGEMLYDDGTLYVENLRLSTQTDVYIASGEPDEVFCPRFTFHGFRYMELTVEEGELVSFEPTVNAVWNDLAPAGEISCDHPMVNQLISNILWGQRSNFISVPTDCPQRNERLGWSGDAQVFCKSACYNMDALEFYKKWLRDLRDGQYECGIYRDVAPKVWDIGGGSPAWADAGIIVPYMLYLFYKDTEIIYENLSSMKRWVDFMEQEALSKFGKLTRIDDGYGDWLAIGENSYTQKSLIGTAFFAYSARLLSEMCGIVEDAEGQAHYTKLSEDVTRTFFAEFYDEDGKTKCNSQTSYLLPLKFELAQGEMEEKIAGHLKESVLAADTHLTTGFVGVSYLLPVLCDIGAADLAYTLLLNDTYPSWGYSIKNGATTIWERWNSYTKEDGFGDIGMNSFNHYSLGSVCEWMYGYMAGIRLTMDNAGFDRVIIQPCVDPQRRIRQVSASHQTRHGKVSVSYTVGEDGVRFKVVTPLADSVFVYPDGREEELAVGENILYFAM